MSTSIWFWVAFHIGVFTVLAIDLLWQKRTPEPVTIREAATWSMIWVILSLAFNVLVWHLKGPQQALDFFTGYVIEYSLSVDNIFVFVLIFSYFKVPAEHQHRVLVWGIIGALVMRGLMIWIGIALVERFHFVLYIFGLFLLATAVRMLFTGDSPLNLEKNFVIRQARKSLPLTKEYHGSKFIVRKEGGWCFTPLALVLIVVDVMDLVFAVDSIPAVFAITTDQFIVYTSNICAILGLRSLYFLLANLVDRFVYLKIGLALVLAFVGLKMIAADWVHLPNWMSLGLITVILAITIVASLIATRNQALTKTRN
ncbi:MAG: TerC family protein [Chthoniobacterales bacterium]